MNLLGALSGIAFFLLPSSRPFNNAIAFRMDLVEECLRQENLEYNRIDSMVQLARRRGLIKFQNFSNAGYGAPTMHTLKHLLRPEELA